MLLYLQTSSLSRPSLPRSPSLKPPYFISHTQREGAHTFEFASSAPCKILASRCTKAGAWPKQVRRFAASLRLLDRSLRPPRPHKLCKICVMSDRINVSRTHVHMSTRSANITSTTGKERGDLEIKDYVVLQKPQTQANRLPPPRTLILDYTMTIPC